MADVITGADGNAGEAIVFLARGSMGIENFERQFFVVFFDEDGTAKIVLFPLDQLFEVGGAKGARERSNVDRFDDIGLAEAIFTDKNVGISFGKIERQNGVVAEIFDLQF